MGKNARLWVWILAGCTKIIVNSYCNMCYCKLYNRICIGTYCSVTPYDRKCPYFLIIETE